MTLFGKKVIFADIMKELCTNHPGLSRWALNPRAGIPKRKEAEELRLKNMTQRRPHEDRGRGWRDAALAESGLEQPEAEETRTRFFLEP